MHTIELDFKAKKNINVFAGIGPDIARDLGGVANMSQSNPLPLRALSHCGSDQDLVF